MLASSTDCSGAVTTVISCAAQHPDAQKQAITGVEAVSGHTNCERAEQPSSNLTTMDGNTHTRTHAYRARDRNVAQRGYERPDHGVASKVWSFWVGLHAPVLVLVHHVGKRTRQRERLVTREHGPAATSGESAVRVASEWHATALIDHCLFAATSSLPPVYSAVYPCPL
jgi:hypothetical protein